MRGIAGGVGFLVFAITATTWAAPVKNQDVTFPSGSEMIAGYLAEPESPGRHPAMLVLHAEWGLTDWVKERTRQLAEQGYVALAVDLYRGRVAYDPALAYELMIGTPPENALRDMEAGLDFLASRGDVNKAKMGSIGWSMGGKWSLWLAVNEPRVAACVSNYGSMPTDPADIQKIHAPVLAIFGGEDRTISADEIEAFEDAMNSAHKSIEVKVYPDAGHGFEDSGTRLGYRENASTDAWQRTVTFLDQHLK